ncbi:MAG: hypothetical protein GEV09_26100 [Pseudonocardiaceae bacterium]|nr:hypothetical protein [Pseudonocardiaceae bacterium]
MRRRRHGQRDDPGSAVTTARPAAVVTGGSRGIGLAIARRLLDDAIDDDVETPRAHRRAAPPSPGIGLTP